MVADAADGDGDTVHFADEAADVGEDSSEVFIAHFHAVALDVEDDVDVVFTSELDMMLVFCARVAPPLDVGSSLQDSTRAAKEFDAQK